MGRRLSGSRNTSKNALQFLHCLVLDTNRILLQQMSWGSRFSSFSKTMIGQLQVLPPPPNHQVLPVRKVTSCSRIVKGTHFCLLTPFTSPWIWKARGEQKGRREWWVRMGAALLALVEGPAWSITTLPNQLQKLNADGSGSVQCLIKEWAECAIGDSHTRLPEGS